jgi:vitamin B12/bleomycin/antimicrobial peptide transport system ATP-binding/permease protein
MATSSNIGGVLRQAWRIAKPYWFSGEKWSALALLAVIVALNLGQVALNVRFNYWRNAFYNTLQNLDESGFYTQIAVFAGLAVFWVAVGTSRAFLNQMLRIRWRRWLTDLYLKRWLDHRAYYRLQLTGPNTDNPDQRIAEDVRDFIDSSLALSLGLLSSVVSLCSFLFILWSLSGPITIPLGPLGEVTVPAYMVWLALVYAVVGTIAAVKIGRPLVGLNFNQQRYEADFRYSLVRLRENTESVAFYRGEPREFDIFRGRFSFIVANFWAIMWRGLKLNGFIFVFGQASVLFPYIVQAPRFFAKQIQLGDLMQTAEAFGQVLDSLSFIINSYSDIATWSSVVRRLATFDARVEEIVVEGDTPRDLAIQQSGTGVTASGIALELPDGKPLISGVELQVEPGHPLLVAGPTGIGKSTVLRAIAGLWPFGRGKVRLAQGRTFFVPQKAYVPLGTLRQALAYPEAGTDIPDERLKAVLKQVGLGAFEGELDTTDNWTQRLSGGEQQRLAFARVFLAEPAVIFLDEATSALDETTEAQFYQMLRDAPWKPAIVSVGHRSTLRAFHDHVLDLRTLGGRPAAAAT